jgi:hypothetical protein
VTQKPIKPEAGIRLNYCDNISIVEGQWSEFDLKHSTDTKQHINLFLGPHEGRMSLTHEIGEKYFDHGGQIFIF